MLKSAKTKDLSLRPFLDAAGRSVFRLSQAISTRYDLTALQYELQRRARYPIIFAERPLLADGRQSELPVVCNLTASRILTAQALGYDDHTEFAARYAAGVKTKIAPVVVPASEAPVQEVVMRGNDIDLTTLPALTQHVGDPGPYLTAAHATTFDPESGTDNTAIQRCWIRDKSWMTYFPYPVTHNARNMRAFWERGEDCPVAFWIGHHPKVLMATQAKLNHPESHWQAAGGVLGAPLRLVSTLTHGEKLMVPADAEIVIEGIVPKGVQTADGPFGEYAGYLGPQVIASICRVTAITRRRDAIYHDYGSGLDDMLVPDNMVMEAKLYSIARQVAPSLVNVHVPASGRRFHAYLQFKDPQPGEARDALAAALSYRRVKSVIAVDTDVDIFDANAMLWALATRVQWDRDAILLKGMSGSTADPSWPKGAKTTSKLGIDATMPPRIPGSPPPIAPRSRVPEENARKAEALLSNLNGDDWPTQ